MGEARGDGTDSATSTGGGHLTVVQGVALYVGAVLGTGLLALPSLAAEAAGPASLLAWMGLIVVSIPVAATFAALAGRYPDAGGPATFARRAFGPRVSAVAGWWFYFGALAGMPAASAFGSAYVTELIGGDQTTTIVVAVILVAITVTVNAFGVRVSGRVQLVFAGVLALLLIVAVVVSVPRADVSNLQPFAPHGISGLAVAMSLLVWAFIGWETVTHLAVEFRNPRRDLPLATGISLAVISVLTLAVAGVTILVLGRKAAQTDAPLALLLAEGTGISARTVTAVIAVVVSLGVLNAFIASLSKLGSALGRDGALPGWLASGSEAGEVPRRSLLVVTIGTALSFVIAMLSGFHIEPLLLAENACLIGIYAIAMAAGTRLLPTGSWGWWLALIALCLVLVVLVLAREYLLFPLVLAVGAVTYRRWSSGGNHNRSADAAAE